MTKRERHKLEQRRKWRRAFRARPGRCLCGSPGTLLKWGDHICQRCFDVEAERDREESRREHRKKRGVDGGLEEYRFRINGKM